MEAHGHADNSWVHADGWAGIVIAAVAWYTSAARVTNGTSPAQVLPVGPPPRDHGLRLTRRHPHTPYGAV